jgi:cyclopropane-fatty-acyl-phospholipid synthase
VGVADLLTPLAERLDHRLGRARRLSVRFWDGSELPPPAGAPAEATLVVRDRGALAQVLREPNQLGFGRAWVRGELDVEGDLARVLEVAHELGGLHLGVTDRLAVARAALRLGALGLRPPRPPAAEARVSGRLHSLRRDRVAVRHHYDVSNEFYRLLLGPTMVYSCAYFESPDDSLDEAQERKLDLICRKLRLRQGHRLLDVGCGWGTLVLHAAARYGARAVGVTLSESQAELARERIREAGVSDLCEVRVADYREVDDGPYDRIASVGMFEHVGRARLGEYFSRLSRLLRPGGLLLNHGIARLAPGKRNDKSFISRFVFPDGELHHLGTVVEAVEGTRLEVRDVESLREHYTLTLRRWLANLAARRAEALAEAGPERERVWRVYMTGSALSFARGDISVYQLLAAAPGGEHGLPLSREALVQAA